MDLDPATPGVQNPFNPYVADSTGNNFDPNPDGIPDGDNDWDGDGVNNKTEFQLGTNPMVSNNHVPLAALPVGLCVLGAGVFMLRSVRASKR